MQRALTLFLALSILVCGGIERPKDTAASDMVVAGVVFQEDPFMNAIVRGYQDAALDAGVKKCLIGQTNNDASIENKLIDSYVAQGIDAIAIAPLGEGISNAALKRANDAGVKVALTYSELKGADYIVCGYLSDGYANGRLAGAEAAQIIRERLGDTPVKLAIVQYQSLLPELSGGRVKGYLDALDAAGIRYTIVADKDAWLADAALGTVAGILSAPVLPQVIIAVNDGATVGAVTAVQNAGLSDQVLVFGYDGSDQISRMLLDDEGPLQATICQDPYSLGYQTMATVIKAAAGAAYTATKGGYDSIPGVVLSARDRHGVNAWRANNGLSEIR